MEPEIDICEEGEMMIKTEEVDDGDDIYGGKQNNINFDNIDKKTDQLESVMVNNIEVKREPMDPLEICQNKRLKTEIDFPQIEKQKYLS